MPSAATKWKLAGLVSAWIASATVVAWLVYDGRQVALARGEASAVAIAAIVEQQVARTFQAIYLTLGAVADAHHLAPRPRRNDPEFQQLMSRRLSDLPFVRALFIVGPDGSMIHDTEFPATPPISLVDRDYFRAYREAPARAQTAWPPLHSRSGTGWFVPVTRGLNENGAFEGVVVAAVQAAYFERQFGAVRLPGDYQVSLFHADGTLVATYPRRTGEVGRNFEELEIFSRVRERPSGAFWTSAGLMRPGERVVSYRAIEGAPFVVTVSRGAEDLLAEWRRTATAAALGMLLLTLLVGWMAARIALDSRRRRRERERRAQAEKLEALGQLSSGVAHDFANVLNVLAVTIATLKARPADRAAIDHALGVLERALASGAQVTSRLLAFARRKPLSVKPVRLDSWLESARPLLVQALGSAIALDLHVSRPLPEILCDEGELDAALVNLLVNARDATDGSGRVSVRAFPSGSSVCLTISDQGAGMTDDVKRRAVEPFYTTKGEAGTGLGLSQVYGFMQQLGGQMRIDSAPGRGTAIHLLFPVAPLGPEADRRDDERQQQ